MSIAPVVPLGESRDLLRESDTSSGKSRSVPGESGNPLEESRGPLEKPGSGPDRLERARRSLLRAERSVGVTPVSHFPTGPAHLPCTLTRSSVASPANASASTLANSPAGMSPVGRVWHCLDGNAALFRVLASACEKGQWVGFLGLDNAGWCAAEEQGIDLRRTLIVPDPSPSPARALAAMIDGLDVVVCGNIDIPQSIHRSIAGRVRTRKCLLFITRAWDGISQPWFDHAAPALQTHTRQHVEAV